MVMVEVVSWNARVDNNTRRGITAIAQGIGPHVIGTTEVARRSDAELSHAGYRLYRHSMKRAKVRGRTPEWRNSAVLVRRDVEVLRITWKVERTPWRGPKAGVRHDPRVWPELVIRVDGKILKVAPALHFPFGDAQDDMARNVARWMRRTLPRRAVLAVGDVNMKFSGWKRRVCSPVRAVAIRGYGVDHGAVKRVKAASVTRFPRYGSDHFAMRYRVWL